MQIVYQRRFIGKIVSADIHNWLLKRDRLNDGAVTRFGHDDIDRSKQSLKGKWERLSGVNAGIARWDWAVEEEAIVAQLFHLFKRNGRQRNTTKSHQDGPFVGREGEG
jgi:hypothetical protein